MRGGALLLATTAACSGALPGVQGPAGPGPWPVANALYGGADGIAETPVVGVTADEAQNRWVATHEALYLLRPGAQRFRRYAAGAGLHLPGNPVQYCDRDLAGGDRACPITGAAAEPGISTIAGGGPGEVFVGYFGNDPGAGDWSDPQRHSGKLDRVRLSADGSLVVDRVDLVSSVTAQFWHNRTVQRLLYDHGRHELYVGTNHGVDRLQPDRYRPPRSGEWFLAVANEWMSDHLHPRVCFHRACTGDESKDTQMMGDWRGLALAPDGDLWVAGKWTAGRIRWTERLASWHSRTGAETFAVAFGDPYPGNPPVFLPPREGDPVSMSAVAVAKDGTVWFASESPNSRDPSYGLASWDGKQFRYFDPRRDAGVPQARDLVALPDGRLAVASGAGISLWDPLAGRRTLVRGGQLLPSDDVLRLELDSTVQPPALHVATRGGAAVLRVFPD